MPLKSASFSAYSPIHCWSIRCALLTYTNRSTAPHSPHSPLCRWCAESTGRRGPRGRQQRGEGRRQPRWCTKKKTHNKKTMRFFTSKYSSRRVFKVPAHLRWINPGVLWSLCIQNKSLSFAFWFQDKTFVFSVDYLDHSTLLWKSIV